MKRVGWLLVILVAGGCGPRKVPVYGDDAPAYGSTPALSTTQGFIVGQWKHHMDTTTAPGKEEKKFGRMLNALLEEEMDVKADGTYILYINRRHKALGRWQANGDGVDFKLSSVDGQLLPPDGRSYHLASSNVVHLTLHADKKRLTRRVNSETGDSFMGTDVWQRVRPIQ